MKHERPTKGKTACAWQRNRHTVSCPRWLATRLASRKRPVRFSLGSVIGLTRCRRVGQKMFDNMLGGSRLWRVKMRTPRTHDLDNAALPTLSLLPVADVRPNHPAVLGGCGLL